MSADSKLKRVPKDGDASLEEIVTNCEGSKYELVIMASLWAKHLKRLEEFKNEPTDVIIDNSIRQVLSGKVSWKDIENNTPPEPAQKSGKNKKKPF